MVFLFIFLVLILFIIVLLLSKVQIKINNFKFHSQTKRHINEDYEVIIQLCFFKVRITKAKLEKIRLKEKVEKINFSALEKLPSLQKEIIREIKKLDIGIKKFELYVELGTESASLTSILVPAISTVIAILLKRKMKKFENQTFQIHPVYLNQNLVKIDFSGIFEIKMSHIIDIIYHLIKSEKKGVKEYERASNRGAYDYSYE